MRLQFKDIVTTKFQASSRFDTGSARAYFQEFYVSRDKGSQMDVLVFDNKPVVAPLFGAHAFVNPSFSCHTVISSTYYTTKTGS